MNRNLLPEHYRLHAFAVLALTATLAQASPDQARITKAEQDIKALESALDLFRGDVGRYPTMQEGLEVLVEPTAELAISGKYKSGGYIDRMPKDPWLHSYQYLQPAARSSLGYDLWTDGADGRPGGDGANCDIGNWPGGFDCADHANRRGALEMRADLLVLGGAFGVIVGLPVYLIGIVVQLRSGKGIGKSLGGVYLRGVLFWVCICALTLALVGPAYVD